MNAAKVRDTSRLKFDNLSVKYMAEVYEQIIHDILEKIQNMAYTKRLAACLSIRKSKPRLITFNTARSANAKNILYRF